jgi:hypothetical protein
VPNGACGASTPHCKTNPQFVGGSIGLTAATPGCTSPSFRYWIFPGAGGTWQILRDYRTDPTYSWNRAGLATGTYSLVVHIRQAGSTADYDTDALPSLSVVGSSYATLSATPALPQPARATIVFTGSAPGSAAQYQFYFCPPGGPGRWHTTSARARPSIGTPTAWPPGTYAWVIYVKQTGSGNAFGSFALISFTVT